MTVDAASHHRCPGPGRPPAFAATSRRDFLRTVGGGFGLLGLADLLERDARASISSSNPLAARAGHFPARAKRCIFLFMVGGPSHIDLFDPKPELNALHGQPLPPSFGKVVSQFV